MYLKKIFSFLFSMTITSSAFAFFCPTNFNQIDIGNTQQQIDAICGKPAKITEIEKEAKDNAPQEWSYFVKEPPMLGSQAPGTIKATIAFDKTGKAINITVNGLSVNTTNLCGKTIVIGTTREMLKAACGAPVYINRAQNSSEPIPIKQIEYRYDSTPPVSLIFENGILVERK